MECLAHRLIEAIASRLSGEQAFHLGEFIGGVAWHFLRKRRRIVIRNLRIAMGGCNDHQVLQTKARECFRRTGANLVSVAWTAGLPVEELRQVLRIRNRELLEETLAEGKGVVLLLTHMGNWEILSRMSHFFPEGTPSGAFYRPLNNPYLDQRVLARRQADGVRMFSKHDSFLKVAGFLRQGAVVGILADQRVGHQGESVRFFGRRTRASPLPSLLARRTKSPVLALLVRCVAPAVWEASYESVENPPHTNHCMAALESAMRPSLVDVFWFQERWRVYVSRRKNAQDWLGEKSSAEEMRHRALIVATEEEGEELLENGWKHPDIDYEVVDARNKEPRELEEILKTREWNAPLPVDFVLTTQDNKALRAACARESIQLVALTGDAKRSATSL